MKTMDEYSLISENDEMLYNAGQQILEAVCDYLGCDVETITEDGDDYYSPDGMYTPIPSTTERLAENGLLIKQKWIDKQVKEAIKDLTTYKLSDYRYVQDAIDNAIDTYFTDRLWYCACYQVVDKDCVTKVKIAA